MAITSNFKAATLLDKINIIDAKLCMTVVFIEFYQSILLLVTLITFEGHCGINLVS